MHDFVHDCLCYKSDLMAIGTRCLARMLRSRHSERLTLSIERHPKQHL